MAASPLGKIMKCLKDLSWRTKERPGSHSHFMNVVFAVVYVKIFCMIPSFVGLHMVLRGATFTCEIDLAWQKPTRSRANRPLHPLQAFHSDGLIEHFLLFCGR